MFRWLEYLLQTFPDSLLTFDECQNACRQLHCGYISHYPSITPSSITAATAIYAGCPLVVLGTRGGSVHVVSLNSSETLFSLAPLTEPGLLGPSPVTDLAYWRGHILIARGSALTFYCTRAMELQTLMLGSFISSISVASDDNDTILLGFVGGSFGWFDTRTKQMQMHTVSQFGSLTSHIYTINKHSPREQMHGGISTCAKLNPSTRTQFFTFAERPGGPVWVWDMRSTSAIHCLNEPSMESGFPLWGSFGQTHLAVVSSRDVVLFYNHRRAYSLEYFSCITTRTSARCVWIDDTRLISGTYSRMREEDQRGFPIVTVPPGSTGDDRSESDSPTELFYVWVNCPFQRGTSAFYPFSSRHLPIINTFYGVAMEDSICILDERPHDPATHMPGADENHYNSGFIYCFDKPRGMPCDNHAFSAIWGPNYRGYYHNVIGAINRLLERRGRPLYGWSKGVSSVASTSNLLNLLLSCSTMGSSVHSLASSRSQSGRPGMSQDLQLRYRFDEYNCYSYSSPQFASQVYQDRDPVSMSPLLKVDLMGFNSNRSPPTWWADPKGGCTEQECYETNSQTTEDEPSCSPANSQEFSFDRP